MSAYCSECFEGERQYNESVRGSDLVGRSGRLSSLGDALTKMDHLVGTMWRGGPGGEDSK